MTLEKAIEILSEAAHGHSFTTGPDFYAALALAVRACNTIKRLKEVLDSCGDLFKTTQ